MLLAESASPDQWEALCSAATTQRITAKLVCFPCLCVCSNFCDVSLFSFWGMCASTVAPVISGPCTLSREAPCPGLCNTHTHMHTEAFAPVCGRGSLHHLRLVGCFSCSLVIFASAPPHGRTRDHLAKLLMIPPAKNTQHRTDPEPKLCRGRTRWRRSPVEFIYRQ